jgi:hypothetical protein
MNIIPLILLLICKQQITGHGINIDVTKGKPEYLNALVACLKWWAFHYFKNDLLIIFLLAIAL